MEVENHLYMLVGTRKTKKQQHITVHQKVQSLESDPPKTPHL